MIRLAIALLCCALIVAGVAFVYWPAGLIVAGILGLALMWDDGKDDADGSPS